MPFHLAFIPILVGAFTVVIFSYGNEIWGRPTTASVAPIANDWNVLHHLGGNSPWFRKTHGVLGGDLGVPHSCVLDQIHMMSRHGERYPTFGTGQRMLELYQRLKHANVTFSYDLSFFDDWDFFAPFPDQQFEQLTSRGPYAGTLQAFTTGVKLRTKYERLLETALSNGPVSFWAADSQRVIDSARYFATGFFGLDYEKSATLHIVPESTETGGNTLTPGRACPRYATDPRGHSSGIERQRMFRANYVPAIVARLEKENPGLAFSESDIYSMQEMCGFEILAKGNSSWCAVFTQNEMLQFEYARDLLHYYRAGPGNHFGPSMGWLWLNATANLLRAGPDDAGPLFMSFNHDGDIIAMLAALELLPQKHHLPTLHVLEDRTWRTSDVTPMGGRIILERFVCPAPQQCWDNAEYGYPNHEYCTPPRNDTFVRINVNDGIVSLPGCRGGPGESCPLDQFLARVKKRGNDLPDYAELCGISADVPRGISFLHQ